MILFVSILISSILFFIIGHQLKHRQTRRLPRFLAIMSFAVGLICMIVPFFIHNVTWIMAGLPLALFGIVAMIRVQLTPIPFIK